MEEELSKKWNCREEIVEEIVECNPNLKLSMNNLRKKSMNSSVREEVFARFTESLHICVWVRHPRAQVDERKAQRM